MLRWELFPCLSPERYFQGQFWPYLGAVNKLHHWLKRNEHEPQSTEALNKLKCTTCTSIWLHIHRWKYWIPLQNAQTRFIHMWKFFTAFSRVFHGLFTFLVSALFLYFSMTIFNFRRKQEDMIFRPPATISDQANVGQARLQVSGHPSNRWHPDK